MPKLKIVARHSIFFTLLTVICNSTIHTEPIVVYLLLQWLPKAPQCYVIVHYLPCFYITISSHSSLRGAHYEEVYGLVLDGVAW